MGGVRHARNCDKIRVVYKVPPNPVIQVPVFGAFFNIGCRSLTLLRRYLQPNDAKLDDPYREAADQNAAFSRSFPQFYGVRPGQS